MICPEGLISIEFEYLSFRLNRIDICGDVGLGYGYIVEDCLVVFGSTCDILCSCSLCFFCLGCLCLGLFITIHECLVEGHFCYCSVLCVGVLVIIGVWMCSLKVWIWKSDHQISYSYTFSIGNVSHPIMPVSGPSSHSIHTCTCIFYF